MTLYENHSQPIYRPYIVYVDSLYTLKMHKNKMYTNCNYLIYIFIVHHNGVECCESELIRSSSSYMTTWEDMTEG